MAPLVKRNWVPAFVDVEEGTYNIDANKIEEAFNNNIGLAQDILNARMSRPLWGWKDPRNSITGHLWVRLIKKLNPELDIYLVCIFREPQNVAHSLGWDDYNDMMVLNNVYNDSIIRIIKEFTNV